MHTISIIPGLLFFIYYFILPSYNLCERNLYMGKEYSAELRNAVLNRYRSGDPVISIADSLGIARSTIYSWINQSIVESRRIEISQYNYRLLEKKVARLERLYGFL